MLLLLLEILGHICILIICCPVFDVINFEIKLSFFRKSFFYITKKSAQKYKYPITKRAFNVKLRAISSFFEGLLLKETKATFLEGEKPTLTHFSPVSHFYTP